MQLSSLAIAAEKPGRGRKGAGRKGKKPSHASPVRALARLAFAASVAMVAALAWGSPVPAQVQRVSVDVEATYQRQPALLDTALSGLQPAAEGPRQLFFVGFAGFGPEAVFKREVVAVRELFDQRFGTRGSLGCTHQSRQHGRRGAACQRRQPGKGAQPPRRIMDKSRDTLFLFLTSHGERGVFIVDMPGFDFGQLTPGRLKRMLDASGIKNRVIVVSACHSGSFVPPLAGPTTLVITAARADRTSFGCDDQRGGPTSATLISTARCGRRPRSRAPSSAPR